LPPIVAFGQLDLPSAVSTRNAFSRKTFHESAGLALIEYGGDLDVDVLGS